MYDLSKIKPNPQDWEVWGFFINIQTLEKNETVSQTLINNNVLKLFFTYTNL